MRLFLHAHEHWRKSSNSVQWLAKSLLEIASIAEAPAMAISCKGNVSQLDGQRDVPSKAGYEVPVAALLERVDTSEDPVERAISGFVGVQPPRKKENVVLPVDSQKLLESVRSAVFQVSASQNVFDDLEPWLTPESTAVKGSGFVAEGGYIVTNASVVRDHAFVAVRSTKGGDQFPVHVHVISYDCDLALLKPVDPTVLEGVKPFKLLDTPRIDQEAISVGYRMGGSEVSLSKGIVSAIQLISQWMRGTELPIISVDAGISFGAGGGPILIDGKVAGVCALKGHEGSLGGALHVSVLRKLLDCARDENIKPGDTKEVSFPSFPVSWQHLENPSLRQDVGLSDGQTGIRVHGVKKHSAIAERLQVGDVITAINHYPIANDGTIAIDDIRLPFTWPYALTKLGDSVLFSIVRDKKPMQVNMTVTDTASKIQLVPPVQYGKQPTFYMRGGIVFQPLNLLTARRLAYHRRMAVAAHLEQTVGKEKDSSCIVVLGFVLPLLLNNGVEEMKYQLVKEVNGKPVTSMIDIIEACERNKGETETIKLRTGEVIVRGRMAIAQADETVRKEYRVRSMASEDLADAVARIRAEVGNQAPV